MKFAMELFLDTDINKFLEVKETLKVQNPPYWSSEVYGFGKYIRAYGRYPQQLPLCIGTDHGVANTDIIYESEIKSDAPVQFYHGPDMVTQWRKRFQKPCYVLFSPFVFYRLQNKIKQSETAKGTLVYPAHTTPDIDDASDFEKYISNLNALPQQYHPISICLHYHDVNKGLHKIFLNKGFRVFCAGSPFDYRFVQNFYEILRQHKYSTSNMVMSCLYYSIEMGIPHFIYGNPPIFINNGDSNLEIGNYDVMSIPKLKKVTVMFQIPSETISNDQMNFVKKELGLTEGISRSKMTFILYKSLVQHMSKKTKSSIARKVAFARKAVSYGKFLLKKRIYSSAHEDNALVTKKLISSLVLYKLKTANYTESELWGKPVQIVGSFWYLHSLREIFVEETYRFNAINDTPYILDCGSNIGLSVIYFKKLFPKAQVVAFEPDVQICQVLQNNLNEFGYSDVKVENKAIWKENTTLEFTSNGALGGRVANGNNDAAVVNNTIKVKAVRLADYLNKQVDFLKIDIEGPEVDVLKDCAQLLVNVRNLFVEYHSDPAKNQELDCLLSMLKNAGFRVYIKEAWNNLPYPFLRNNYNPFYDLQLNIFAYRA